MSQFNFLSVLGAENGMAIGDGGANAQQYAGPIPPVVSPAAPPVPLVGNPSASSAYDAILKVCDGAGGFSLASITVAQGAQDSLNFANGAHDVTVSGTLGVGAVPGVRVVTSKGPNRNLAFGATVLAQAGTEEEIALGDWLDESYGAPDRLDLTQVTRADGQRVRVVVGHSPWPKTNANQTVLLWRSLCMKGYWWFKRFARLCCGTPLGTPGPANFLGFINLGGDER
jgi:hypothetical protein